MEGECFPIDLLFVIMDVCVPQGNLKMIRSCFFCLNWVNHEWFSYLDLGSVEQQCLIGGEHRVAEAQVLVDCLSGCSELRVYCASVFNGYVPREHLFYNL